MAELMRVILAQSESVKTLQGKTEAMHATIEEIKPAVLELQKWKPEMESTVEGIRSEMGELKSQVVQIARNPVLALRPVDLPTIIPLPKAKRKLEPETDQTPSRKEGTTRVLGERCLELLGHRDEVIHRGRGHGDGFPASFRPGNGTFDRSELESHTNDFGGNSAKHHGTYHHHHPSPKLDFPQFDGENPKAWQLKCENYFRICSVHPEFRINVATMYFVGGALLWLQASKAHHRIQNWEDFAKAMCNRFGREEFQQLVR